MMGNDERMKKERKKSIYYYKDKVLEGVGGGRGRGRWNEAKIDIVVEIYKYA